MSEKLKMLYYLQQNHYYFESIDTNLFYILESIDTSELNTMNENSLLVTPLLKQITNYALVSLAIGEDEEEVLRLALNNDELLDSILEFCGCCCNYLECLSSDFCLHPSVVNLINVSCSNKIYNLISDLITNLIQRTSNDIQDSLIDFCNNVVDNTDTITENQFAKKIIQFIEKNQFINEKQLLPLLTNYALDTARVLMLFEKDKKVYHEENITINMLKNNEIEIENDEYDIPFFSIGNALMDFTSLMQQIDEYLLTCYDFIIKEKLEQIKELYHLYISYRCDYFKNDYIEQQMIQKCKKL